MKRKDSKREAMRILNRMLGTAAVNEFLRTPQPALEGKNGQELLESEQKALLGMLKAREKETRDAL